MRCKTGVQPSESVLQTRSAAAGRRRFGLRWQSAAATPLSERGPGSKSGVALRFPPQSKIVRDMRNQLRIRRPENCGHGPTHQPSQNNMRPVRCIPRQAWNVVIALIFVVLLLMSLVLGRRASGRVSAAYIPTITSSSVTKSSLAVTHGTNHTFYYRGRLRWEWDEWRKRLVLGRSGLGSRNSQQTLRTSSAASQRLVCRTPEPAVVLWLSCKHSGRPPQPAGFRYRIADAQGHKRTGRVTGGVCDLVRGVTVSNCPLLGGIEKYRGGSIRLMDNSNGTELVRITIR